MSKIAYQRLKSASVMATFYGAICVIIGALVFAVFQFPKTAMAILAGNIVFSIWRAYTTRNRI